MEMIFELLLYAVLAPVRPIAFLCSRKYRNKISAEFDGDKKRIFVYICEKVILFIATIILIVGSVFAILYLFKK
jgi:hypothetical protein